MHNTLYREVYLRVVNALAANNGSTRRMIAWDHPGMHNGCMIVTVSAECFDALSKEERYQSMSEWPVSAEALENDEALNNAIETAHEMELDDLVEVQVTIDGISLIETLRRIDPTSAL